MDEASRICAILIREGAVLRSSIPELDFKEIRQEVESRLGDAGLVLAASAYSEYVGIRLSPEISADQAFDGPSNLGLRGDACALLAILWAKLVLQKRTVRDSQQVPGQSQLFSSDRLEAAQEYAPHVFLETLSQEFGDVLGSDSRIEGLLTELSRHGFVRRKGGRIEAGPFLELGIDGDRMISFVRGRVLAELIEKAAGLPPEVAEEPVVRRVLDALDLIGHPAKMGELVAATGERKERLREVLKPLIEDGRVVRAGEKGKTTYTRAA